MNTSRISSLAVRNADLVVLVAALIDLEALTAKFEELKITVPGWIGTKISEVKFEIEAQTRAEKEAKLARLKAQRAALATPEEKRKSLDAEIAALEG